MPDPTTGLLSTVVQTLDEHGTRWHQLEDDAVTFRITLERATHDFFVTTNDELGLVSCLVAIDPRVPDARRIAVAEAIVRINGKLGVGHFELDFDDGELCWRCTADVEGGLFTSAMMDALLAVAFGGDEPALAVAAAEV
jgi:hypothetical protein